MTVETPGGPDVRIGFGKHRGRLVSTLPDSYLLWLLTEFEPDSEQDVVVVDAARAERRFRDGHTLTADELKLVGGRSRDVRT